MWGTPFVSMETWKRGRSTDQGTAEQKKDELRVTQCCYNKLPLPLSSTVVLSHGKKHFHHCVPRNTICSFFNYIASVRQQTEPNLDCFVIHKMKLQVFCKIRLATSPWLTPVSAPVLLHVPQSHVCTLGMTVAAQLVSAMQLLTFALEILE